MEEIKFVEKYFDKSNYKLSLYNKTTNEEIGFVLLELNGDLNRYGEYCNGNKLAHIVRLETKYSYTKQGVAHTLLNKLFTDFNNWNFSLFVYPEYRGEKDFNKKDLQKWYTQFGFERTKELISTMVKKATI